MLENPFGAECPEKNPESFYELKKNYYKGGEK